MLSIAVLSQKGGSGKSTIAVGLAVAHELVGGVAVVIDVDPQGSASVWHDLRNADRPAVVATHAPRVPSVIEAARNGGADLMLIDTPPAVSDIALASARAADFALVPCRAAVADLHAIGATLDVCRLAGVPAGVVLNAAPPAGKLADQARRAMVDRGATVSPVTLCQRVAHIYSFTRGQTAMEHDPAGKAAAELAALYRWTIDQGGRSQ